MRSLLLAPFFSRGAPTFSLRERLTFDENHIWWTSCKWPLFDWRLPCRNNSSAKRPGGHRTHDLLFTYSEWSSAIAIAMRMANGGGRDFLGNASQLHQASSRPVFQQQFTYHWPSRIRPVAQDCNHQLQVLALTILTLTTPVPLTR